MSEQQHNEGELDLTSEPLLPAPQLPKAVSPNRPASRPPTSARIYFKCCRVYAVLRVPDGVLNGQLSSWRFHCPRCGQLSEIPL